MTQPRLCAARLCAIAPALAALLMTGCTPAGKFPSLALRPQEDVPGRVAGTLAAPAITLPAPVPASLAAATADDAARIASLGDEARAANSRFAAARARTDALTASARGTAPGSEAWSRAAVALADLTAQRDATLVALASIDAIEVRQTIDGGDGGAIAAVRDQVTAWVADEDAVLAELGERVRS